MYQETYHVQLISITKFTNYSQVKFCSQVSLNARFNRVTNFCSQVPLEYSKGRHTLLSALARDPRKGPCLLAVFRRSACSTAMHKTQLGPTEEK